jgi:hypothetical protein
VGFAGTFSYYIDMKRVIFQALLIALLTPLSGASAAPQSAQMQTFTDDASGLLAWKAVHPGFSLQFVQVLPNYVRAIYGARGLPDDVVELMAGYCIFGTIIKNESAGTLSYRVADWNYETSDGVQHSVKTKSQWLQDWKERGVAFRWLMLPDSQTFAPGDWSQGFTTLAVPPDTPVKIHYSWTEQGTRHEGTFKNLRCAPAVAPRL